MDADLEILKALAGGNAICFVGAGPSIAMGYPSWLELCQSIGKSFDRQGIAYDRAGYDEYLTANNLPTVMKVFENASSRELLLRCADECLKKNKDGNDDLYSVLCRLPFKSYLTTNYDNELINHLNKLNRDFDVLLNSESDCASLSSSSGSDGFVFKLHGDFSNPKTIIMTSTDYLSFKKGEDRAYLREYLKALLITRRCVFIGYSLDDENIRDLLEDISVRVTDLNPIYMFVDAASDTKIREFRERYGVIVMPYSKKAGGKHYRLVRKLETINKFLQYGGESPMHTVDSHKAVSMYYFKTLNTVRDELDVFNWVLLNLPSSKDKPIAKQQFCTDWKLKEHDLKVVLAKANEKGLISFTGDAFVRRSAAGDKLCKHVLTIHENEKNAAMAPIVQKLADPARAEEQIKLLELAIARIFECRGESIVRNIFGEKGFTSGELLDFYGILSSVAMSVSNPEERIEFIENVRKFIITPTEHQKKYLAAMSQGYFLYKLMGEDPSVASLVHNEFAQYCWYVDSNAILPLLAPGSFNHDFTVDLFAELRKLGAKLILTSDVFKELEDHLNWAATQVVSQTGLLPVASLDGGNYQNLFVDGYVHHKAEGKTSSFVRYAGFARSMLANNAERLCRAYGIRFEQYSVVTEHDEQLSKETKDAIKEVLQIKEIDELGYRGIADAGILYQILKRQKQNIVGNKNEKVCFLSQGLSLKRSRFAIRTWTVQSLFGYVQTIGVGIASHKTLHQCLLGELYGAGVRFIDENVYKKFFSDEIDAARRTFDEEANEYVKWIGSYENVSELRKEFDDLDDLRKPIFINQMRLREAQNIERLKEMHEEELGKYKEALQLVTGEKAESDRERAVLQKKVEELERNLRKERGRRETEVGALRNKLKKRKN